MKTGKQLLKCHILALMFHAFMSNQRFKLSHMFIFLEKYHRNMQILHNLQYVQYGSWIKG